MDLTFRFLRWNKGWPKAGYFAPFGFDGLTDAPGDYLTNRLTDEALKFITKNRERPFFLDSATFPPFTIPSKARPNWSRSTRRNLTANPRPRARASHSFWRAIPMASLRSR